ncbi:hypothetical protein [Pedobacter punctiformis]|uniref:Beta-carotene 15,15'-monooxygenase n=1 Tax=Pedobacter punctiformis TaxID=3004097 RepID=A0ABT4L755_9SPHI|nr:hypothetical protein [Pedobacter sp. HCMS5-2]MCZ4243757.1 hypothetical protein [Pedobacter sp. HCMS5-2]
MFSLLILFVLIRLANKYLDKGADKLAVIENPNMGNKPIQSYFPLVFHLLITVLLLISCFTPGVLNEERIHILVTDGIFQFVSTFLILIISMINPFAPLSAGISEKLLEKSKEQDFKWMNWFLKGRNWQLVKGLACVLIVAYFINSGYLVIPDFNKGILSGVIVFLIVFFILSNLIQLINNPIYFKKATLFRLSMLYRSFKLSFFIAGGIILLIFIISLVLNLEIKNIVNLEGIALLVYNIIMAYNEYKVLDTRLINDTSVVP